MAGVQHRRDPSPMAIQKSDVVLVKPSHSTPLPRLSLSTIDDDPWIETLSKTIYVYKPSNTIPHLDPASLLQHALSKALVYYYPLAGKLKRRSDDRKLQLSCTAEGVPFIRATAACTLNSLDAADVNTTYQLVPNYDHVTDGYYHPLAMQVTMFSCGGFTVGTAISHSVCDGFGAAQFFQAMTELASGMREPTVKPVWERHRLVGQVLDDDNDPNAKPFDLGVVPVATSAYAAPANDDMVREIVNVTSDGIKRLKASTMKQMLGADDDDVGGVVITTLETLGAYVWRARCRALKLNPEGNTLFGIPVSVRGVLEPPLPEGYYGNAFVNASFTLRAKELNDSPLSHIVKHIKNLKKKALDKRYVKDQLSEMEKTRTTKAKLEIESQNGAFMFLSDWRQRGYLDEVDFGWKASVDVMPVLPLNLPDVCMFLPGMDGGVRVMVTLPRAAMPAFLEEMDALVH